MHERVQEALQVLIGKPLWSSGRAADLEWSQFGQRKTIQGVRGDTKEVGEYALHVQCAWRMRHSDQVVVASRDLYYPATETDGPVQDFDWDVQGANRRDRLIAELFQNETRQFSVQEVTVGNAGAFTILFRDAYALDVFPDDSLRDEHWRIFKPYAGESHFVLRGSGRRDG